MSSEPKSEHETPAPAPAPSPSADAPKTNVGGEPPKRPPHHHEVHQVVFVTYPKLLFIWPILLMGYVLWPVAYPAHEAPPAAVSAEAPAASPAAAQPAPGTVHVGRSHRLEDIGWLYIWVVVIVILTMGIDVNRNQAAFLAAVILVIWGFGLWLRDVKGFTFFGDIYRWFANLDVQYDRNLGLVISILLSVPYAIMLMWGRFNDYWRITHNEFEHYAFGRLDDSLGRGAKTIRTEFPDMLELLLGMAGTLVVRDSSGQRELRRIPHVMFLPMVRKRLNLVLERMAVTTGAITEDDEEDGASPP